MRQALGWAAGVAGVEATARALILSRARAWIVSYGALAFCHLMAGRVAGRREAPSNGSSRRGPGAGMAAGVALSLFGYPLGRRLLGDTTGPAPVDGLALDLAALGMVVPLVEEGVWGARVEPDVGVPATAALFALKHVVVDRRWRRALGLAAFWTGLGLVRKRSPRAAVTVHCVCNAGAVLWGHASGRDQF